MSMNKNDAKIKKILTIYIKNSRIKCRLLHSRQKINNSNYYPLTSYLCYM